MFSFKLDKKQLWTQARGVKTALSILCLCSSVISGISALNISPLINKKIENDGYSFTDGNINSLFNSDKVSLPDSSTAHFHIPDFFEVNASDLKYGKDFLNQKADIASQYLPYLRLYFFGYSNENDKEITNKMLLSQVQFTYYSNDIEMDLTYLNYFSNLKEFNISMNYLEKINNLPYLESVEKVNINSYTNEHDIYYTVDFAQQLKRSFPNLKSIYFGDRMIFEPGSLECMNESKLEYIDIPMSINMDIDFNYLGFLTQLNLRYNDPYDVAVSLNTEEYNNLINSGTKISFKSQTDEINYLYACKELDKIIEKLQLNDNMSFSEKLDKIIVYILDSGDYSERIAYLIENEIELSDDDINLVDKIYKHGFLSFDSERLCGVYAALTEALIDRIAEPDTSYFLNSENHAWNIIKEGNKTYYLDTTFMDYDDNYYAKYNPYYVTNRDKVAMGLGQTAPNDISWYKENITLDNKNEADIYSHTPDYVPPYMNINNYFPNTIQDSESKMMEKIFISKFTHLMSREEAKKLLESGQQQEKVAELLFGMFAILGFAFLPKKSLKNKNEKTI